MLIPCLTCVEVCSSEWLAGSISTLSDTIGCCCPELGQGQGTPVITWPPECGGLPAGDVLFVYTADGITMGTVVQQTCRMDDFLHTVSNTGTDDANPK